MSTILTPSLRAPSREFRVLTNLRAYYLPASGVSRKPWAFSFSCKVPENEWILCPKSDFPVLELEINFIFPYSYYLMFQRHEHRPINHSSSVFISAHTGPVAPGRLTLLGLLSFVSQIRIGVIFVSPSSEIAWWEWPFYARISPISHCEIDLICLFFFNTHR